MRFNCRKLFLSLFLLSHFAVVAQSSLFPVPFNVTHGKGKFEVNHKFYIISADSNTRVSSACERLLKRLDNSTGLLLDKNIYHKPLEGRNNYLKIAYKNIAQLKIGEDESYQLEIASNSASLTAETDLGILHGLETFYQLVENDSAGFFINATTINDKPRFTWRGLMIDVSRHFMPVDVILRNIDGMAMVKLNVLHLHLSDDQGFRIECKAFPKLTQKGSNGEYYTQQQVKEIILYAGERGIRVVPEFDMPGHTTAWFTAYPELATTKRTYSIEKKFGQFSPALNPASNYTYKFLEIFLKEMCALFPDAYFHIGGDENDGKEWDASVEVQKFKTKNNLKNNTELQNYFNRKLLSILVKNKKKMVGWDEILQPDLPKDALIQSWRGKEGIKNAITLSHAVILSAGYYIDLSHTAAEHYLNDPIPENLVLNSDEEKLVLGGEATMWSELVSPENIDSRIWPRTAAIAERLWSPRSVKNVDNMYKRLDVVSLQLESLGLQHLKNQDMMLRRITGTNAITPLKIMLGAVSPLKDYKRGAGEISYSTDLPLSRLPDIAVPDPSDARKFQLLCSHYIIKNDAVTGGEIRKMLQLWMDNNESLIKLTAGNPALLEWQKLSLSLFKVAQVGMESLDKTSNRNSISDDWISSCKEILKNAEMPVHESELVIIEPVKLLFQNALAK